MAIEYDQRADHYIALGVASTATHDDIKKAHRALIRELHPDHGGESMSAAQVNIARDVLLNPITREEYDQARRSWHERNPIVSAFSNAAQYAHDARGPRQSAPASQQADGVGSARTRRAASPHDLDTTQPQPSDEWRVDIMTTLVADEFMQATLAGQWLKAIAIIGSAYIVDRVIENRIRKHPAARGIVDAIADEIRQQRATRLVEAIVTKAGYRWDAVTEAWILPTPCSAQPTDSRSAAAPAPRRSKAPRRQTLARSGVLERSRRPRSP